MTTEERNAIRLLSHCTFLPASYDKRFVRSMAEALAAELAHEENRVILTDRQHNCLMEKVHRYRRQHGRCDCLVCLAEAMKKENPYQGDLFGEVKL